MIPMRGGGMGAGVEWARRISAHIEVSSENTEGYHTCRRTADRRYDGGGNVGREPVGGNQKEGEENRIRRVSATSLILFAEPGAADSDSRPFWSKIREVSPQRAAEKKAVSCRPAKRPWPFLADSPFL